MNTSVFDTFLAHRYFLYYVYEFMYYKSARIMYVHVLSAQRLEECQALELDLQLVVSHHVGPENQSEACYKDNHVL